MSGPDATATAALAGEVVRPKFLCWLDIVGDPVRATTWPVSLEMSGTGDPDLDGYTFSAIDPTLVTVSTVKFQSGGSDTVTVSLSGLLLPDNDLLNIIGDPSKWRGREARLWQGIADADFAQQGAIWAYYTGRMVSCSLKGNASNGIIEISIETYLAALSPPSNRTYLDQEYFDPDDLSAKATLAVINGLNNPTNPIVSGAGPGAQSLGGGSPIGNPWVKQV